jgi:hypothetical protein
MIKERRNGKLWMEAVYLFQGNIQEFGPRGTLAIIVSQPRLELVTYRMQVRKATT